VIAVSCQRSAVGLISCALLFAICGPTGAQQPVKPPTIGLLVGGSASSDAVRIEALREGLRELGYVDATNIAVEYRYGEGKPDRLTELAAGLVRLQLDVIVTAGPTATHAAKKATNTIPVVMAHDADPVGAGFVASLARPGGNITGLSNLAPEISGKRLELLKEIVPRLSHVAALGTSTQSSAHVLRGRTRRKGIRNAVSIPRRIRPQGYSDRVPRSNQETG
jgi:putative tryptophan/tyrosine transport system substrate-binding protein